MAATGRRRTLDRSRTEGPFGRGLHHKEHRVDASLRERLRIREVVENWVLWRDAGDWERFRGVWHPDARMMATWFQGPAAAFIDVSREGFKRGVRILHFLG